MLKCHICIIIFGLVLLLYCCANPVSPRGGPQDMSAPQLLEEASTPNYLTGFDRRTIELVFDEFIELNDPFNSIIITPALEHRPEIEARRRTLTIRLDEEEQLESNTTYSIQFGNAIRDYTEGNVADNIRYVFSTGAVIDSFSIRSRVVDAESGKPVGGAWLMLYDEFSDSLVYRRKPFYFTRTDSSGYATISNIRLDTFLMTALKDENGNYLYDGGEEMIAFTDSLIYIDQEEMQGPLMYLFHEQRSPVVAGRHRPFINQLNLYIEGAMHLLDYSVENDRVIVAQSPDSLHFWWDPGQGDAGRILFSGPDSYRDTIKLETAGDQADLPRLKVLSPNAQVYGSEAAIIKFNLPLDSLNEEKLRLLDTAGNRMQIGSAGIDSSDRRRLIIYMAGNAPDSFVIGAGALSDYLGRQNESMALPVKYYRADELSSINLRVEAMDSTRPYVVELYRGSILVDRRLTFDAGEANWLFEYLPIAEYRLRIVEDRNENGFYDGGNYFKRELPEPFVERTVSGLRPNWEKEIEINFERQQQYK